MFDGDGQLVGYAQTRTINGTMAAGWPQTSNFLTSTGCDNYNSETLQR